MSVRRSGIKQLGTSWRVCLVALTVVVCAFVLVPQADAADFTWTGAAPVGEPNWSNPTNWGGVAPSGTVETLTFPELDVAIGSGCYLRTTTCYQTNNDVGGLHADALSLGCGYGLTGDAITLGGGGLSTTCTGESNNYFGLPVTLGASQTWFIPAAGIEPTGLEQWTTLELGADITGTSAALTIYVGEGDIRILPSSDVEAGPITIFGGGIDLLSGGLNTTDGNPVILTNTSLGGHGAVGALTTSASVLAPEGDLAVSGEVTLDSATELKFTAAGSGVYSQLTATGNVNLANARLTFSTSPECSLTPGEQYSVITTSGSLIGTFAGLPNGSRVQTKCGGGAQVVRLNYTTHSVTATALAPAPPMSVTDAASNVTSTSATLNGALTPGDFAVSGCYFEYGETTAYGSKGTCGQAMIGEGTTPVAVSADVMDLTPGTTYHVRLAAANANGTGDGKDETFTTTGTAAPTIVTGAASSNWFSSSATLTGTIDPHGNDVTYTFYYGSSSVNVSSFSDIVAGYSGNTGSSAASGTNVINVSADINGLGHDTPYYVRLVVFYNGSVAWGSEVRFEITPPEPEAAEAPSLAVSGTDAKSGYAVRCNTGNWRNVNGFVIRWSYVGSDGPTGGAMGRVDNLNYPGDEYFVSEQDIGHLLACVVIPRRLNGSPDYAYQLQSDTLLPESEKLLVIPKWLKAVWEGVDAAGTLKDVYELALGCGPVLAIPFVGELTCLADLADFAFGDPLEEALKEAVDPPDPHFREVALPRAVPSASQAPYRCPGRIGHPQCHALAALAARFAQSASSVASLFEAFAVSRNRTLVARTKGDTETELLQVAARKTYGGLLAKALAAQQSAGIALAEALRRSHVDVRIAAGTLRAMARARGAKLVSRRLLARMLKDGYRRSEIGRALSASERDIKGFDLQRYLMHSALPVPFGRYYDTMELNDLLALTTGLARQHALRASAVTQLLADLDRARAACTPSARAEAVETFLHDAKLSLQAPFYSFLSTAAQPLIDGSSTVDPYPRCLG